MGAPVSTVISLESGIASLAVLSLAVSLMSLDAVESSAALPFTDSGLSAPVAVSLVASHLRVLAAS